MQQRDLFGNLISEERQTIAYPWSHSRANCLESCNLKYFFQYYGSKGRSAKNIPDKQRIIFLSHLATKHLIAGTIIHDAIDHYFRQYKAGTNYNLSMLLTWAYNKFEAICRLTEQARINEHIKFDSRDKISKELYYRTVDPEKFKIEIREKITINLTNFLDAKEFEEFRIGGKQKSSFLEKWVIFKLMGYVSIKGKLDLSFDSSTGKYYIIDWKTGNVEYEETSLQLLIYAIWAIEEMKIDPERVLLFKAYLQENRVEQLEFSDDNILRAKMHVIQDTEAIEKLHKYGIEGTIAAFSKIDFPNKICPQCPFEEICHKNVANGNKY